MVVMLYITALFKSIFYGFINLALCAHCVFYVHCAFAMSRSNFN